MTTGRITAAVIAGMLILAAAGLVGAQTGLAGAREMTEELTARLGAAQTENAQLRRDIASADEPETVERLARQKLGLVRPGDIIFIYSEDGE